MFFKRVRIKSLPPVGQNESGTHLLLAHFDRCILLHILERVGSTLLYSNTSDFHSNFSSDRGVKAYVSVNWRPPIRLYPQLTWNSHEAGFPRRPKMCDLLSDFYRQTRNRCRHSIFRLSFSGFSARSRFADCLHG